MKRLTLSRVARWQADCEKLARKQRQLREDVRSYYLNAKGSRYSRLTDILAALREIEDGMKHADDLFALLAKSETRTTTSKGSE